MSRWRLDLAYDGTDFVGWAAQPGQRSVQGLLEQWITQTLRLPEPVTLVVAGRTDAGVHAAHQVAHVDLPTGHDPDERSGGRDLALVLHRRLSRVLPEDVTVHAVTEVPDFFDARFSASWRAYRYRIWDDLSVREPSIRHRVAPVKGELNLPAMRTAADSLLGLGDFAAFCRPRRGATTIRTLLDLSVERAADGTVDVDVRADAFCHSMVRSLVGALVGVGLGKRNLAWVAGLLDERRRNSDVFVMPARGLTLEQVGYPPVEEWARRAEQARTMRHRAELARAARPDHPIPTPDESEQR